MEKVTYTREQIRARIIEVFGKNASTTKRAKACALALEEFLAGGELTRADFHKLGGLNEDSNMALDQLKQLWLVPVRTRRVKGCKVAIYDMRTAEITAFMTPELRKEQEKRQRIIVNANRDIRDAKTSREFIRTVGEGNALEMAMKIASLPPVDLSDGDTHTENVDIIAATLPATLSTGGESGAPATAAAN